VASPYTRHPGGTAAPPSPRELEALHSSVIADRVPDTLVRRLVQESWNRSLTLRLDPDARLTAVEIPGEELRLYRNTHPLAAVLPTLHRLLIRHTFDTGLIVAVGDQSGRLLWIDGDRTLRTKAEQMLFVEGANWSESAMGTSAPGTALALDHAVQIHGAEHFNRMVHPWSCSAVPVHDPDTGAVLGVIDITGGRDAVAPNTLPLIEAAVAAVEAELHFRRLDDADRSSTSRSSSRSVSASPVGRARIIPPSTAHAANRHETGHPGPLPPLGEQTAPRSVSRSVQSISAGRALLSVLGRDGGHLETASKAVRLSPRHAEILTLLAWHPEGLSADRLRRLLYGDDGSTLSLRAEIVRLRRVLEQLDAPPVIHSRPYRLGEPLELDVHRVLTFVERGAHRVALAAYTGHLLPASQSPGIREIGDEIQALLRDHILTDGSVETVLDYARTDDAAYDAEVWRTALRLLPPRSPKRAAVVARIERIESQLAATLPQPGAP
jgi:hypothetical protein